MLNNLSLKQIIVNLTLVCFILYLSLLRGYDKREEHLQSAKLFKPASSDSIDEPNESIKIAWLMTFPNSGTSYTTRVVRHLTNTTTATNYDEIPILEPVSSLPKYSHGPFILRPELPITKQGYILTKTHCTESRLGYALINGAEQFIKGCTRGAKGNDGKYQYYDAAIVKRAVHLFRDPFDNIVARFHLQSKEHNKTQNKEWIQKYPYTKEGFRRWCTDYKLNANEKEIFLSLNVSDSMLCPLEFYWYVQFHNNALEATRLLNIPVHTLHYLDYEIDFDKTVSSLLEFLNLDPVENKESPFEMKSYEHFFHFEEKEEIAKFLNKYSSNGTWKQIHERYLSRFFLPKRI